MDVLRMAGTAWTALRRAARQGGGQGQGRHDRLRTGRDGPRVAPLGLGIVLAVLAGRPVTGQTVVGSAFRLSAGPCTLVSGTGAPEGVVTGKVCDRYVNATDGVTWEKWTGAGTTGWRVGFNAAARVNGDVDITGYVGEPGFVSQLTNWRIDNTGGADFRYLFTDALHAKAFVADLEQALAGGQIISKSVAVVAQAFTCPPLGGSTSLTVEDLPGAPNMRVFEENDFVVLRNFLRGTGTNGAAEGSLVIGDCVGRVHDAGGGGGTQRWTFDRGAGIAGGLMPPGIVIPVRALALDYGVSGNGFWEVNAIDGTYGINSPYAQVVTWAGSPTSGAKTLRTRLGNLRGVTGLTEYGALLGTYGTTGAESYARISDRAVELRNLDVSIWNGGVETIRLEHTTPSIALGAAVPGGYLAGTGIWMGRDTDGSYKFRAGNPLSGAGLFWDGAALTVRGTNGASRNQVRNSECRVSTEDWTAGTTTGLTLALGFNFAPAYTLNGEPNTCYVTFTDTPVVPAAGTVTFGHLTGQPFVVEAGRFYELSAYLGLYRATNALVFINWLDDNGVYLTSAFGSTCGPTDIAVTGGTTPNRFCRSVVIAQAPAGAATADTYVLMNHDGVGQNPFLFWVRALFGEATSSQTEASAWGPGGITEITGGLIRTGTITADKITVGSLAALSANLGTVTAGTINGVVINGTTINGSSFNGGTVNIGSGNLTIDNAGILGARVANFTNGTSTNLQVGHLTGTQVDVQTSLGLPFPGGGNRFLCVDNQGVVYPATGGC